MADIEAAVARLRQWPLGEIRAEVGPPTFDDVRTLLAALDAATARVRALEAQVRNVTDAGEHLRICRLYDTGNTAECDCGMADLFAALAPATGEENG